MNPHDPHQNGHPHENGVPHDASAVPGDELPGDSGLSPRQEAAIAALLAQPTIAKAALACGVGERTIYTWMSEEVFHLAYRKARREAFGHAIGLCQHYAPMAVQALAKVMADPGSPSPSKVSAASALLKFSRESIELDDLAQRVEALEADEKERAR